MKILEKDANKKFPFDWVNLDYLPESNGGKREIYLQDNVNITEGLIFMFYLLFRSTKNNIQIYNSSWWDFCLDTWDSNKADETKDYLKILYESHIEYGYSGSCNCFNWDRFLHVTLRCIITHKAPYSPIFYEDRNDFFFYFHHSGSIGIYYKNNNET